MIAWAWRRRSRCVCRCSIIAWLKRLSDCERAHTDVDQPPKAWFKAALKDVLPEVVINRRKRGFSPPVMEWHRALFASYGDSLRDGYLIQHSVLNEASASHLASGHFPHR